MAKKWVCDLCGEEKEGGSVPDYTIRLRPSLFVSGTWLELDLCSKCADRVSRMLSSWMKVVKKK